MSSTAPLPLEGVRVLEFCHTIMGLSAGMLLADLGVPVAGLGTKRKHSTDANSDRIQTQPFNRVRRRGPKTRRPIATAPQVETSTPAAATSFARPASG